MSSSVKIISQLSLLAVVLLIAIYHSLRISEHANNEEESVSKSQVFRYRRAIQSTTHYCRSNQYYDQKEGRCLGVPGGGKVLHVENGRSCGDNILKPHCESPLYYHICKRDKSILAQCSSKQIFDNRLQRCVQYDTITLTPSTISPHNQHQYDHVQVPNCTKPGRFPVSDYCFMFYSCESNGHRLYQSVFKCPQNTGYQVDKGTCTVLADCKNDDSVNSKVCVSDAPEEIVELRNFDRAAEQTVESSSERIAETTTESLVKKANSDDRTEIELNSSTEASEAPYLTSTASDILKSFPITDASTQLNEETQDTTTEYYKINDVTETVQNSSTDVVDPYLASTVSDIPESSSINDASTQSDKEIQNTTTEQYKTDDDTTETIQNSSPETIDPYLTSTTSDILKSFPINDASTQLNEKTQDTTTEYYKINDVTATVQNSSTDVVDPYLASTVSDISESSSINDVSTQSDKEIQNTTTEQYKTDDDTTETIQNSSPETIDPYLTSTTSDILKSFPITDASTQLNEETQDTTTEYYKINDVTETVQNSSTDVVDPYLASTVSDIPESSSINDVSTQSDKEIQNTTTEQYKTDDDTTETIQNSSPETIDPYLTSTTSDILKSFPINDASTQLNEKTQDTTTEYYKINDVTETAQNSSTDVVDPYLASTVSDIPESSLINDASTQSDKEIQNTTTEQYKTDDDTTETIQKSSTETIDPYLTSTASDILKSLSINDASTQFNEETQNTTTEYYKIDDALTETVQNSSTEADLHSTSTVSDVSESLSNTSTQLEETRSAITEQYEDVNRTATLSNFTPEVIDQGPTSEVNDVPATTSNPYSNAFDTLTSVSDTMISQKTVDVNEHTTEELSETTPSIDSKSADSDLHETEEITTQHTRENTDDDAELSATTIASFILRHATTPVDSTTITSIIQDVPAVSEKTDLVTQNSSEGLP